MCRRTRTELRQILRGLAVPLLWVALGWGAGAAACLGAVRAAPVAIRAAFGEAGSAALAQAGQAIVYLPVLARSAQAPWATPLPPATRPAAGATGTPAPSATVDPATPDPATPDPVTPDPEPATAIPSDFAPFGLVRLEPELLLEGSGSIIDSLAFWEAPDAADSLLLVTAKGNQRVEVWQQPFAGRELPALQHPSFGTGTQVNGIVVDQALDRVYVSVSRPASTVAVFDLPDLRFRGQLVAAAVDLRSEPNLALLELPDGARRLYVSADDRVYAYDPESGAALGSFAPAEGLETLLADAFDQVLYIPDETHRSGIYAYRPDGSPYRRGGETRFGGQGIFEADAEGIAGYRCPADGRADDGRGWLIVSDQKADASDFEFFDRRSWAHLGRLQLAGVRNTDGIASTQQALPGHPAGLFAAANNDRDVALVGWDRILAATGLDCAKAPRPAATVTPVGRP